MFTLMLSVVGGLVLVLVFVVVVVGWSVGGGCCAVVVAENGVKTHRRRTGQLSGLCHGAMMRNDAQCQLQSDTVLSIDCAFFCNGSMASRWPTQVLSSGLVVGEAKIARFARALWGAKV